MSSIPINGGTSVRTVSRTRTNRVSGLDVLVFVIPFVQFLRFNVIGVLTGTDLLLLITFLVFAFRGKILIPSRNARNFFIFGCLWLTSQIVTDLIRHTPVADVARGWSSISLTMVNFAILCALLYGRPRRIIIYGWGLFAGVMMTVLLLPIDVGDENLWKMGYAYPISMAIFLFCCRKNLSTKVKMVLMFGMGLLNMLFSARSMGGICLGAAAYVAFTPVLRKRTAIGADVKVGVKIAMVVAAVIGVAGVYSGYTYLVEKGFLGDEARQKYELQSSGKYGVLLGGRTELFSTIPAIIDSPLIGHGSWARDVKYVIEMREALLLLRYKGALAMSRDELIDGLIPAHSFLLGAWVWAGFLGAVFWAWVWTLIARSFNVVYPAAASLLPLMAYFSMLLLWDILFSPFGLDRRQQVPYYLTLIITYFDLALKSTRQNQEKKLKPIRKPAAANGD